MDDKSHSQSFFNRRRKTSGEQKVPAYEFYWYDESGEEHLIGILPERRIDPERITAESIANWAKILLGGERESSNVFYSTVSLEKGKGGNFYATPILHGQLLR